MLDTVWESLALFGEAETSDTAVLDNATSICRSVRMWVMSQDVTQACLLEEQVAWKVPVLGKAEQ